MHRFNRLCLTILLVGVSMALGIGSSALAQEKNYPTKAITYLTTFNPGGQSDREARRQQPLLESILGQKVIVDYKVGGGGALGWSELVRSKPDGYL
ncbi:MAG: tripartite tricarboxylate transporter substrate-binding protein, partial [Desulfobacterales bacterium]|nr:tripartite tricarboxylate transporter substrate-binding protein [Desulfobacterales bacterium]